MPKGHPHISREVKQQILKRIKEEGIPVAQVAQEHGLSTKTIYRWVAGGITSPPSILEVAKLKRENQALKEFIGEITLELRLEKKKADDR